MTRATWVLAIILAVFAAFLLCWAVHTNLQEKHRRHVEERQAIENLRRGQEVPGRGLPLPPVVLNDFRQAVRRALAQDRGAKAGANPGGEASPAAEAAIRKATDAALQAAAGRLQRPEPFMRGWRDQLRLAELSLRDQAASGQSPPTTRSR